jgi:hypothetical protein
MLGQESGLNGHFAIRVCRFLVDLSGNVRAVELLYVLMSSEILDFSRALLLSASVE